MLIEAKADVTATDNDNITGKQKTFRVKCFARGRGVNIINIGLFFTNVTKISHQMPDFFLLKMHQIQFSAGATPVPTGEAHSAPPDLLAGFSEKGRERRKGGREKRGEKGR